MSRVLRTWGASESGLAEALQGRIDALDADGETPAAGAVTLAFLASGIEGIKVRITARAPTLAEGTALLDLEEKEVRVGHRGPTGRHRVRRGRRVHGGRRGGPAVVARGLTLRRGRVAHRRAHRLPSGQCPRRLGLVPGRRGGLPRAGEVRRARACPSARWSPRRPPPPWPKGCAGPPVPTSGWASPGWPGRTTRRGWRRAPSSSGWPYPDGRTEARELRLPGDRERVRQYGAISALDLLRRALIALGS